MGTPKYVHRVVWYELFNLFKIFFKGSYKKLGQSDFSEGFILEIRFLDPEFACNKNWLNWSSCYQYSNDMFFYCKQINKSLNDKKKL